MKYLTTDKHPFGKDHVIKFIDDKYYLYLENEVLEDNILIDNEKIATWVIRDIIKEIQEPKWTDDDMKRFAKYWDDRTFDNLDQWLQDWKKENNKNL